MENPESDDRTPGTTTVRIDCTERRRDFSGDMRNTSSQQFSHSFTVALTGTVPRLSLLGIRRLIVIRLIL
jgi:hypothetical protein